MSRNTEFTANHQLAERRRTPRPLSRPEREIRDMNRMHWLVRAITVAVVLFPAYVVAVEVFVK